MHQASVGFHCPECTKVGAQKVYTARNLQGLAGQPVITTAIIAINVVVFLIGIAAGDTMSRSVDFSVDYGLFGPFIDVNGEWWRIVTSGFLHSGLIHLGFNMFFIWMLGRQLEGAFGWWRYLLLYAASLLAGSFGALLVEPTAVTVGASGAAYGLMGGAIAAQRAQRIDIWDSGLGSLLLINLVISFAVPGISIGGHVGGLVGGFLVGTAYYELPRRTEQQWLSAAVAVGICGLAVVGGLWAASTWTDPLF
jgi:membrane associated rhomboid family serine protease